MKKIFMLALVLATIATTAFSNPSGNIEKQAVINFNRNYSTAKEVKWESVGTCMKVTFTLDGQQMFAYYNESGEQIALTRNIVSTQLPIALGSQLREKLNGQWLTELFEISTNDETTYFATLYNADQITVLKADVFGNWIVFKKTKRAA